MVATALRIKKIKWMSMRTCRLRLYGQMIIEMTATVHRVTIAVLIEIARFMTLVEIEVGVDTTVGAGKETDQRMIDGSTAMGSTHVQEAAATDEDFVMSSSTLAKRIHCAWAGISLGKFARDCGARRSGSNFQPCALRP